MTLSRSTKHLEEAGYTVDTVERRVTRNVTKDLFGMFDLIAVRENETLGVQVTSRSNVSARIRKITESPILSCVRKAGWRIEVHGWDKRDGKDRVRVEDIS